MSTPTAAAIGVFAVTMTLVLAALARRRRRSVTPGKVSVTIDDSLRPNEDAKLAPFLPTSQSGIDKALEFLEVGPSDTLVDLGCGDGRLIVTAAQRFGTRCVGVEYDPKFVTRAAERVEAAGVQHLVTVLHADALTFDFSDASVVFIFLTPKGLAKIGERLVQAYHRGARIAAYMFSIRQLPCAAHDHVRGMCPVYLYDSRKPAVELPEPVGKSGSDGSGGGGGVAAAGVESGRGGGASASRGSALERLARKMRADKLRKSNRGGLGKGKGDSSGSGGGGSGGADAMDDDAASASRSARGAQHEREVGSATYIVRKLKEAALARQTVEGKGR